MSHITIRTNPQDEKNIDRICRRYKINRSDAVRLALDTAATLLKSHIPKKKFSSFIGCFEGPEDMSSKSRSLVKKKLRKDHESTQ